MTHTERVCLYVQGKLEGLSECSGRGLLGGSTHPLELDPCFCEPPSSTQRCGGLVGLWEVKVHSLVRGGERKRWGCWW